MQTIAVSQRGLYHLTRSSMQHQDGAAFVESGACLTVSFARSSRATLNASLAFASTHRQDKSQKMVPILPQPALMRKLNFGVSTLNTSSKSASTWALMTVMSTLSSFIRWECIWPAGLRIRLGDCGTWRRKKNFCAKKATPALFSPWPFNPTEVFSAVATFTA